MRIRIVKPVMVRFEGQPGDEIVVQRATPELEALLASRHLSGDRIAEVIDDGDEVATVDAIGETATKPRGSRGSQRSTSVPA